LKGDKMKKLKWIMLVLAAIIIAAPVSADRVIFAPTGTILSGGEFKAEGAIQASGDNNKIYWLGVGLQQLELNVTRIEFDTDSVTESMEKSLRPTKAIFDLAPDTGDKVNIVGAAMSIVPETSLTPGVAVGIWDLTDETADGIGYYIAMSKVVPLTQELPLPIQDVKVHAGYGIKGIDGLFAGAEASLPLGLKLSAEWFQDELNYALGWGIGNTLQVKGYILDDETFYGLQFSSPL